MKTTVTPCLYKTHCPARMRYGDMTTGCSVFDQHKCEHLGDYELAKAEMHAATMPRYPMIHIERLEENEAAIPATKN